ncbi:peptidase [Apibacter muscae]|uniref:tRNA (5-methylaminomethyl-2-thiouridine)(34)-methyltransferase MnmD n=1 Tax=Apibacter muscae TaxID=2509004 RepID=UPI0011ABE3FF|nr:tRNA (5-methylaminomethyl-2-thiouridine)(34)-methyltransferase MnmD [Apibacter muscae]TWP29561.1 peptidase [Apibacter muscae]
MLKRVVVTTKEGSKTLQIPEWNESYHSQHGILQEASHVFIKNGLELINLSKISILEMGFGTGFNALLTLFKALNYNKKITYYTLEKYPLEINELLELEYWKLIDDSRAKDYYLQLHHCEWGRIVQIHENFEIVKYPSDFFDLYKLPIHNINLVYYDAFGARVQPHLWEEEIFTQIINTMAPQSLLTTYSSKGSARRAMQKAGFSVEKLAGPIGKREMVNAWKI